MRRCLQLIVRRVDIASFRVVLFYGSSVFGFRYSFFVSDASTVAATRRGAARRRLERVRASFIYLCCFFFSMFGWLDVELAFEIPRREREALKALESDSDTTSAPLALRPLLDALRTEPRQSGVSMGRGWGGGGDDVVVVCAQNASSSRTCSIFDILLLFFGAALRRALAVPELAATFTNWLQVACCACVCACFIYIFPFR